MSGGPSWSNSPVRLGSVKGGLPCIGQSVCSRPGWVVTIHTIEQYDNMAHSTHWGGSLADTRAHRTAAMGWGYSAYSAMIGRVTQAYA
eukprot:scaffold6837_cov141-Isochrysis_galbana.AAC.2